ncbi:LOW QUALITY PROTEIN: arf-GAP with SH3 domain, ANK repeat and PH domain-containing protein 2-like [Lethenteron reissneri]|uniref:LOW QUALITY PROTEIN: arf-GAP with SH3 domain, ANK repeat and PH domain-containing protein 2-like n=1 Tax=Lethenteron reissneri TaxID=7753 RepID=UPI002AB796BA|nr:LOW QUALITY PROTEIN: arf-GAP with SH3 domain, ANK repeat and PH domain-containing protein 2-like [Lethenteron reissneri]
MMMDMFSVDEFLEECRENGTNSTNSSSTFSSKMNVYKKSFSNIEEALETDRGCLQKMKKYVKTMCTSGQTYVENEELFSNYLEKFGNNYLEREEPHLATAFLKFSVYTKELSSHLKSMNRQVNNVIVFSLDTLLKGDLKEVKGDLKKSFDKTWKDYETKMSKTEKEEDMERERKAVQLQMCEYLIKVNEIQSKKGADFLQHLIKLYHTHSSFFQDSLKIVESLKGSVEDLTAELTNIKQAQDDERKKLCAMKDKLKDSLQVESKEDAGKLQAVYSLHQLQGNKTHGNEKSGHLLKKSDGIRKVWQKRKCDVRNGFLLIYHGVANRQPAKLNLLTCQVKPSAEDRKCFSLISYNRTYHFQVEDERECAVWVSVLTNSKEEAMNNAFKGEHGADISSVQELTSDIILEVQSMPGNDTCCDCSVADPSWLATNLGILTCIECSGIHREMGVHVSRIQSITLDVLSTAELLLARNVGNYRFNEILESNLPTDCDIKPAADSDMNERRSYITAKYIERKYTKRSAQSSADKAAALCAALVAKDVFALIEVYSEGVDLLEPLDAAHVQEKGETALHFAVRQSDRSSLHLVDFLILNCRNVNKQTENGNTALHYCSRYNATECLKLLLRSKAALHVSNEAGETALDIAKQMDNAQCEDLLTLAEKGLFNPRTPVEYNWKLDKDDLCESEDELDEKPARNIRPTSCITRASQVSSEHESQKAAKRRLTLPAGYSTQDVNTAAAPAVLAASRVADIPTPSSPGGSRKLAMASPGSADGPGGRRKPPPPPPNRPLHKRTHSEPFGPSQLRNSTPPPIPPLPHISPILSKSGRKSFPQTKNLPAGLQESVENAALARRPSTQRPRPAPPSPPDNCAVESGVVDGSKVSREPISRPRPHPPLPPKPQEMPHRPPVPLPRKPPLMKPKIKRVKAKYDCQADQKDELTFMKGDTIVVEREEDDEWWHGYVEGVPARRGAFPVSFIEQLTD